MTSHVFTLQFAHNSRLDALSYGELVLPQSGIWTDVYAEHRAVLTIELAGYCNYSGSSIERANFEALRESFELCNWYAELSGSHGSQSVAVILPESIDAVIKSTESDADILSLLEDSADESLRELSGILASLEDYPLICDETHHRVEQAILLVSWQEYAFDGVASSIECETLSELVSDSDESDALNWLMRLDQFAYLVEVESAVSAYFDVAKIAELIEAHYSEFHSLPY